MKKKLAAFLSQKRDILIFIGILLVAFGCIFTVAFAIKDTDTKMNEQKEQPEDPNNPVLEIKEKMILPVSGEYEIVREYFDEKNTSTMNLAIINRGNIFVESTGIGYSKENNDIFDCYACFSGTVESVQSHDLEGYTIVMKHDDRVKTVYQSLSSITVKEGQKVKQGEKIGISGASINDTEIGVHIYLEVLLDNININPTPCIGKTLDELETSMQK